MTQEEKLKLAREWYNDPSTTQEEKHHLLKLVPKLGKNTDEDIRKGLIRAVSYNRRGETLYSTNVTREEAIDWLEKQGEKHVEPVTVVERDGEQWVRVCACGEDFIIAAHDYRDGDKTEFTWEEACKIGTFTKKQGYIMLALKDEINAKLKEIGGEPLDSPYWSSSEYYSNNAWLVYFSSGYVNYYYKYNSFVARAVASI